MKYYSLLFLLGELAPLTISWQTKKKSIIYYITNLEHYGIVLNVLLYLLITILFLKMFFYARVSKQYFAITEEVSREIILSTGGASSNISEALCELSKNVINNPINIKLVKQSF